MADHTPIVQLDDVRYRWPGRASFGLHVPSLTLARSETVLLLGESGAGKSTLLSLICGTIIAESGCVSVAGTSIAALSAGKRDRFRAEQIGLIFQQFNLLPFASVQDNILLPLRFAPNRRKRVRDLKAEAKRLCHDLGLPSDVMLYRPDGRTIRQQQRVAAARALIGTPPFIIADERRHRWMRRRKKHFWNSCSPNQVHMIRRFSWLATTRASPASSTGLFTWRTSPKLRVMRYDPASRLSITYGTCFDGWHDHSGNCFVGYVVYWCRKGADWRQSQFR